MKNKKSDSIKTLLTVLLVVAVIFALAACGGESETSETPEISDVSQVSEASVEDDSSVAAVESTEESSEVSDEESAEESSEISQEESSEESSEEVSEAKPDYSLENYYIAPHYRVISRIVRDKKRYGVLYEAQDDKSVFLPPEYEYIRQLGKHDNAFFAVKSLYDVDDAVVFSQLGVCLGEYYTAKHPYGVMGRPLCDFGVFQKKDGGYVIIGNDGKPLYDNITNICIPNFMCSDYMYFESSDGKYYIAEYDETENDGFGVVYTTRFCEVENIDEYTDANLPLMLEVAEKFITAMAEKDEAVIKECMTDKLYLVFKSDGNEQVFSQIYGVPRGSFCFEEGDDRCSQYVFTKTWVNPLPGTESLVEYPAVLPYVQMWMTKGADGVWRVSDVRPEYEV